MAHRGRPKGYVMSEVSRLKISEKLKGRCLTEEHKRKISLAMMGNQNRVNHNKKNLLDDLYGEYAEDYCDEEVGQWIHSHAEEILTLSGVLSDYKLSSLSFIELNVDDISSIVADSITPETIAIILETVGSKEEFFEVLK